MEDATVTPVSLAAEPRADGIPSQPPEADLVPLKEDGTSPPQQETIDPYQRDSLEAEQAYEEALRAAQTEDESQVVQRFLRAAKIAETAHEWHLAALSMERIGDYLNTPGGVYNRNRAFRLYQRAVRAYEECGLFNEARELTYRIMYLKMRCGRELGLDLFGRLELFFFWATSGFGVRPFRVVVTGIALVLAFGFLFWTLDAVVPASEPHHVNLAEAIYFSGVTFSTIGYGDFVPASHARLLALLEGALGMITMSYFVVVLANRLGK